MQRRLFLLPEFRRGWSDAILIIRLLFTVPISNAKLERMFSKLKLVKTNIRCSLGVNRLENILRIMEEGRIWETFGPTYVRKKWSTDKVRYTTEEKRSRSHKSRNSAKVNVTTLSDDDSYDEEENISENGDEEGYCLLLIPSKIIIFFFVAKWIVHNMFCCIKKILTFWVNMLYFLILILPTFFNNNCADNFTDLFIKFC